MRKAQVSIKSQTKVMAKKLQKITIFKRLRDIWFGNFFVRRYKNIREDTRVIQAKTPGLYQVPNWSYDQNTLNTKQTDGRIDGGSNAPLDHMG